MEASFFPGAASLSLPPSSALDTADLDDHGGDAIDPRLELAAKRGLRGDAAAADHFAENPLAERPSVKDYYETLRRLLRDARDVESKAAIFGLKYELRHLPGAGDPGALDHRRVRLGAHGPGRAHVRAGRRWTA